MTARHEIRAKRRFDELNAKGFMVTMDEVMKNIQDRDYTDTHRSESPLRQADDAVVLDNSNLTEQEQFQFALDLVRKKYWSSGLILHFLKCNQRKNLIWFTCNFFNVHFQFVKIMLCFNSTQDFEPGITVELNYKRMEEDCLWCFAWLSFGSYNLNNLIPHCRNDFDLILPDLRGFGKSPV